MATVRLAQQNGAQGFSRIVAVKTLLDRSAPDSDLVTMFRDEIRVASRVSHPNVVPVLDVVAGDDQLLLVMEYVHGESVSRLLKRCRSAIPPKIASTIMAGVLRGLQAAHLARSDRGELLHVVHRDVTPHNIVVGVDGTPRLLDFGIAHAVGRIHATRVGHIKGKLAYMAPEQFQNAVVDLRVDIYAAAVTLWEMLTGRRLFEGHKDKVLKMILHQTVQPPSFLQRAIPRELDAIVLRGLHRDPRRRYETAREMAIALEQKTETVSATELGDWVRRIWGEGRNRREDQIRAIENNLSPTGEGEGPPEATPSSGAGPLRRLPSSQSTTRALDLGGESTPNPQEPEEPEETTRPDILSPAFALVPAIADLRWSPAVAASARVASGPPRSGVRRHAPALLAAAAVLLAAYAVPGARRQSELGPGPLAISVAPPPPPHFPSIEPLRSGAGLAPAKGSMARAPYGGAQAASSASVPPSKPDDQPMPALPSGTTTANAPGDPEPRSLAGTWPRLARPPTTAVPASPARPHQEKSNLRRRASTRRSPVPATAVAAAGRPSKRALSTASSSGRTVRPVASSAAPAEPPETNCDPPFVIESTGIKHFKLACL